MWAALSGLDSYKCLYPAQAVGLGCDGPPFQGSIPGRHVNLTQAVGLGYDGSPLRGCVGRAT
jgi:hypothetical protein